MITLAAIPLKNCRQCSHYRGGFCYGFGTAKQVFSESEALLCGTYTPLGQVQIGPLDSLAGQLLEYQIPSGVISTVKLADLAVTVGKLAASSVINSKVAGDAGIVESKLSLDHGTDALNTLISENDVDIASNLALILLREETANKDQVNGYLGLDASAKVPLSKLNPLTNSEIDAAAAIIESKLNLTFGTSALNTDIQTREESANKGAVSGYCGLDASQLVPLANLSNLTNTQLAAAAAIIESKLSLDHSTQSLFDKVGTDIGTHAGVSSAHHVKYTNAEAIAAVQAEPTLTLSGLLQVATKIGIGKYPVYAVDIQGVNAVDVSLNTARFNDASYGIAWYMKKARGTVAVPVIVNNNDFLYELVGYGHDGTAFIQAAKIEFRVDGTPGTNDMPGRMTFSTTPDGGITPTVAVVIDSQQRMSLMDNLLLQAGKTVDGVDVSAEPARITAEIDSDISTHAGLPSAHHTAYTDAMALAAVDEHLVLESANATWIYCPLEGWNPQANSQLDSYGHVENTGAGLMNVLWGVPLPTNRGGKELYISGTRVGLNDADLNNRVVDTYVYGLTDGADPTQLDVDPTDKSTIGEHEDLSMGALDCSPYDAIRIRLKCDTDTAVALEIQYVTVRYYYA